ncbi:hypothetical protein [uncultured Sphingomonas sp.]|uniref:hypothetical protein n=1 Tax=uncultured Sphingomonas sp. TaxID=158754 RepID=UPI0025D5AE35|nr:hypothetical protein [uncultured Sphingomonas sp.]
MLATPFAIRQPDAVSTRPWYRRQRGAKVGEAAPGGNVAPGSGSNDRIVAIPRRCRIADQPCCDTADEQLSAIDHAFVLVIEKKGAAGEA